MFLHHLYGRYEYQIELLFRDVVYTLSNLPAPCLDLFFYLVFAYALWFVPRQVRPSDHCLVLNSFVIKIFAFAIEWFNDVLYCLSIACRQSRTLLQMPVIYIFNKDMTNIGFCLLVSKIRTWTIVPLPQQSCRRGILVSTCPSVLRCVRLSSESCPLCIFSSTS